MLGTFENFQHNAFPAAGALFTPQLLAAVNARTAGKTYFILRTDRDLADVRNNLFARHLDFAATAFISRLLAVHCADRGELIDLHQELPAKQ
jgi:hypothetical protein